jgi:hypothetical protein
MCLCMNREVGRVSVYERRPVGNRVRGTELNRV